MHQEIFISLGLSINEARIYEALIELGEASVNTISIKTKINRSNVYDATERLLEKGLVSDLFMKRQKYYKANHPRRLVELLKEKEEHVEAIMPELVKKFESKFEKEEAYFYRGIEGYKNYVTDMIGQGKTIYTIGGKGFWLDPRLKYFMHHVERERKRKGIKLREIMDEGVEKNTPDLLKLENSEFRILPKKYCSKMSVDFFGDQVVIYSGEKHGKLKEDPTLFVLKSKEISDGLKKLFDFMWEHCEKVE